MAKKSHKSEEIVAKLRQVDIVELAKTYRRNGYRRITALLRRAGWAVNAKRVQRIWRREGLKVPQKQSKPRPSLAERRLLRASARRAAGGSGRRSPTRLQPIRRGSRRPGTILRASMHRSGCSRAANGTRPGTSSATASSRRARSCEIADICSRHLSADGAERVMRKRNFDPTARRCATWLCSRSFRPCGTGRGENSSSWSRSAKGFACG